MLLKRSEKGFGLIEILIIGIIIVVAIGGLAALLVRTLQGNRESANHVIATYLAEEGVVLFDHLRKQNRLKQWQYDESFELDTNKYILDFIDNNRRRTNNAGDPANYYDYNDSRLTLCDLTAGSPVLHDSCRLYTQPYTPIGSAYGYVYPCARSYFHNDTVWPAFGSDGACDVSFGAFVATPFYRQIQVQSYTSTSDCPQRPEHAGVPGCKRVESTVAWQEKGVTRIVKTATFFYDLAE